MAELSTMARPYAQAVFELAREHNDLESWSDMLEFVTAVVTHEDMQAPLNNPRTSKSQVAGLILDICGDRLDKPGANMIKVLADNNRLTLLPEITEQYEQFRADAENTIQAELISALPVSDEKQNKIAGALKKRLGREIELTCTIDESRLGGAVIRAGDLVIDGSASGRLDKLSNTLRNA